MSFLVESGQWSAVQHATWKGWGAMLFAAIMSSLVAHSGTFYLVARYPVTSVAPLLLLSPLFGIFFGVTLLHEQLTLRMWLGGFTTLLGVFIVAVREKKIVDVGT
jgi:O-acetylserine/cysteine efflux transporter